MDIGPNFERNQKKLASVSEAQWAVALKKGEHHIRIRLKKRTTYGAHTDANLGEDPFDYYLSYAYEAILSGTWEWKDKNSLSQQLILIINSTISTEVEKTTTTKATKMKRVDVDFVDLCYDQDPIPDDLPMVREIIINKQISVIEEAIVGNEDLEIFWECIKEGMKRTEIADLMEKTPKQVDKIRERLMKKIKESPHFEMD